MSYVRGIRRKLLIFSEVVYRRFMRIIVMQTFEARSGSLVLHSVRPVRLRKIVKEPSLWPGDIPRIHVHPLEESVPV